MSETAISSCIGDVEELKRKPGAWEAHAFSAEELRQKNSPPINWMLPNIVPGVGVTLLCSKPKFGKSWLAYDLCIAATMRRYTLGELQPAQGDVLYLALEDSERRLKQRMEKLLGPGFAGVWPKALTISTKWRRLHEGGLEDIRDWHARTRENGGKPLMVVIDVLAKVRQPTGNKPAYESDYAALTGLHQLAHELCICIVVIHHTRKMQSDDAMEMVSGSFGIVGAADTIIVLASKAGGVVLDIRGRDTESQELAVSFNKESCKWSILGNALEVHQSDQRRRIIAALQENREPMKIADLTATTGMKRAALDVLLSRMTKDGLIKRVRCGQYASADYIPPKQSGSYSSYLSEDAESQTAGRAETVEQQGETPNDLPSYSSCATLASSVPTPKLVRMEKDLKDGKSEPQVAELKTDSHPANLTGWEKDRKDARKVVSASPAMNRYVGITPASSAEMWTAEL